jgi:hypothetical protein
MAAKQDLPVADVRFGSFSTGTRPAAGPAVSAVAPKAEVRVLESVSTGRSGLMMRLLRDSSSQTGAANQRYELTDYEWAAIKPFLSNKPRHF